MALLLTLRPLQPSLVDQATALDQHCLGGLWTREGYLQEIESSCSDLLALCYRGQEETETLIGMGCLWSILEEGHITLLVIHPDYRGLGLGQMMLWSLLRSAQQRQLAWAALEVAVSNLTARRLYEKFGFTQVGLRKGYYPTTGEDALVLWRKGLQDKEFTQALQSWQARLQSQLQQAKIVLVS